ncbi:hypothetical protein CDS [Salmonella enterica subsp. enterica serovar Derby]|nr:hypothetical protein CDS [Salmonella enterica subsp. enterica serovar Derby]
MARFAIHHHFILSWIHEQDGIVLLAIFTRGMQRKLYG